MSSRAGFWAHGKGEVDGGCFSARVGGGVALLWSDTKEGKHAIESNRKKGRRELDALSTYDQTACFGRDLDDESSDRGPDDDVHERDPRKE